MSRKNKGKNGNQPKSIHVLDHTIFLHSPKDAIESFKNSIIIIPSCVIVKLREISWGNGHYEQSYNAGLALEAIDQYTKTGDASSGIKTKVGGTLIISHGKIKSDLPLDIGDDYTQLLIQGYRFWANKYPKQKTELVSKDGGLRSLARSLGVNATNYKSDQVTDLPTGIVEFALTDKDLQHINLLFTHQEIDAKCFINSVKLSQLYPNQCCKIHYKDNKDERTVLAIYKKKDNIFKLVEGPVAAKEKIGPRNEEQAFGLALLMDPEIKVVAILGHAGTGKTYISLLAGSKQIGDENSPYRKMSVFRPQSQIDKEMPALPGDENDKFSPWKEAIYENFNIINNHNNPDKELYGKKKKKRFSKSGLHNFNRNSDEQYAQSLELFHMLTVEPLCFIGGRTWHCCYVILDEAQDTTRETIKVFGTRTGEGTKIVLQGNPGQIHGTYKKYIDDRSCGLVITIKYLLGREEFGFVTFTKTERSDIAELFDKMN